MKNILIISTGGTFNKRYNPIDGSLEIETSSKYIDIIASKWLSDFKVLSIIGKDSLNINNKDREELFWQHDHVRLYGLDYGKRLSKAGFIVEESNFIEEIGNFDGSGKKILFLIQSGFPEASQSDTVKKQMEFLAERWKMENLGIIIKPGAEGIRLMPEIMNRKIFKQMNSFGKQLAQNGKFKKADLNKIATPYKLSKSKIKLQKLLQKTGLTNLYWNINLKKNNAFKRRFDAPYLE